jgi:hypothetical protein
MIKHSLLAFIEQIHRQQIALKTTDLVYSGTQNMYTLLPAPDSHRKCVELKIKDVPMK